jgi:hypothetical protein
MEVYGPCHTSCLACGILQLVNAYFMVNCAMSNFKEKNAMIAAW